MTRKKGDKVTSDGVLIDGIYNGFPYTGPPLHLKHDDPEHMKPQFIAEVTVDTFYMDDPEHVEQYRKYMEDVGRGWAKISREEMEWIPGRETWKVFLRLMHNKYIAPEDRSRVQEGV